MTELRNESTQYKLGYLGRTPRQDIYDHWTFKELGDYNRGKRDRAKVQRKNRRKDLVANIFAAIAAVFGIILLIVTWAVVSAMPVLVVVLFLKLLGVI